MVRGFYQLGSGMLTQNRVLGAISNNIANVDTTGYKKSKVTASSFGQMVVNRVDSQKTPLASVTMACIADTNTTIHSEGTFKPTDRTLDFALSGQGFFAVQSNNGVVYTRNGSFNLDDQGYLIVKGVGRVIGQNGPIHLGTDAITADAQGDLMVNGNTVDKISIYDFDNYHDLSSTGEGTYTGANAKLSANPQVRWKTLEGSNVDTAEEMTNAIAAQRNLQSCSEILKMYDQVLEKAATAIGKV